MRRTRTCRAESACARYTLRSRAGRGRLARSPKDRRGRDAGPAPRRARRRREPPVRWTRRRRRAPARGRKGFAGSFELLGALQPLGYRGEEAAGVFLLGLAIDLV